MTPPTDHEIIAYAREVGFAGVKPEIEFDAEVSRAEDGSGAYVQAWVWVQFEDMKEET